MKVHVACVTHQHGANFYVSLTEGGMWQRVATEFVAQYVQEASDPEALQKYLDQKEYDKAAQEYFIDHPTETLYIGRDDDALNLWKKPK